jgi:hypothetical protein
MIGVNRMKINKLLSMICDPVKRQMLTEFKVLGFCFSHQVQRFVDDKEEEFHKVLSELKVDKNGYAEATFLNFKLIVTAFEIDNDKQAESTVIVHVVSIDEQFESVIQKQDIQNFLNSGAIEIE